MASRTGRWLSITAAAALAFPMAPIATPAMAQGWNNAPSCWGLEGRDRARCENERTRWQNERNRQDRDRKRERDRRKDAKTDGVVAGVIGTVLIGGIIAAAASGNNKEKSRQRDRRSYCLDRYGNYDERTDSYRASDGRWYRCE